MSKKPNFDYPHPPAWELAEEYVVPYRFSTELQAEVLYLFTHPNTKYGQLFHNQHKAGDLNDMLKRPYLYIRHYMDNPQMYGHDLSNLTGTIMVAMWKTFLRLNIKLRGMQVDKYLPADLCKVELFENRLMDRFVADILSGNYIGDGDELVKYREGIGARDRKNVSYTEAQLKYYEGL